MAVSVTGSPTNVDFKDDTPSPKPDSCNVEWQGGPAVFDSTSGQWIRDVSACYRYPQVGGVFVIDDNAVDPYNISATDSGQILVVNRTTSITLLLSAVAPFFDSPAQGVWNVEIVNIGAGVVTLDPNGLNLDTAASTVTINQGEGRRISTDGTDYYSGLVVVASGGGGGNFADGEVPSGTINGSNTSFTLAHTPLGMPIVIQDGMSPESGASSFGFTQSGTSLTLTDAPQRSLRVWYRY